MDLNPYAKFLDGRDPIPVITSTADHLRALTESLSPAQADAPPAPGKWSVREIIAHLADCELVFSFRLRQTLSEEHAIIQPFDQEKWAAPYALFDAVSALAVFTSLRDWNCKLIATVPAEAYAKPLTHPERGEMFFRTLVETMGGHDLNHLKQLEPLAA